MFLKNQNQSRAYAAFSEDSGNFKAHCTSAIFLKHYESFKKFMYACNQNIPMYKSNILKFK